MVRRRTRTKKQHPEDCFCWKCFMEDVDRAIEAGLIIEDKKHRLYTTDEEGLAAYRKNNPQDFQLST